MSQPQITNFLHRQQDPASTSVTRTAKRKMEKDLKDTPFPKKDKPDSGTDNIAQSLNALSGQISNMSSRIDNVLDKLERNDVRMAAVEDKVDWHESNLASVGYRLNEIEQKQKNAQLEVTGLVTQHEFNRHKAKDLFIKYLHRIKIPVSETEVVDAYVNQRNIRESQQNVLIVTFLHEAIKNRIMHEKIKHDKNNGNPSVFFGNILTRVNHQLLMKARHAVKDKSIMRAWSFNGNIFILRSQEEQDQVERHEPPE